MATQPKQRQRYTFGIQETAELDFAEDFRRRFSKFEVKEDERVIEYTAKGANKTDVTRRLERIGVDPDALFDEARSGTTVLETR